MNALRKIAAGSLAAVLACSMAACGSGNANSTDSASNTGKTVKVDEKSAKATSISDFGGMDGLVAAAEKEGALNVIALPHDWSNYGDVISGFKKKYPKIKINEQNPNASSKEEVDAGKTNKGTDAAPDVYDLGLAVASTSTDNFPRTRCRPGTRSRIPSRIRTASTTPTTPASCPSAGTPTSTATSSPSTT